MKNADPDLAGLANLFWEPKAKAPYEANHNRNEHWEKDLVHNLLNIWGTGCSPGCLLPIFLKESTFFDNPDPKHCFDTQKILLRPLRKILKALMLQIKIFQWHKMILTREKCRRPFMTRKSRLEPAASGSAKHGSFCSGSLFKTKIETQLKR